jgi:intein/homing endonuclease
MCGRAGLLIARRLFQRKLVLGLVIVVLFAIGIAFYAQTQANAYLIETYKKLDNKDFQIQSSVVKSTDVKASLAEIYCGAQMDKAMAYFDELKNKGLRLKLDSVKYKEVKVLKHDWTTAVLLVDSKYSGNFVKAEKEEIMRKLAVDTLCQVDLARSGNQWKIADVVVLEEK